MRTLRRIVVPAIGTLCVMAMCFTQTTSLAAEPFTVQQLMQVLATHKASRVAFVEKKYLSSLDRPLESSGELSYTAPSRLEKKTVQPKPETLVVDGNTLVVDRNGSRHTLSLASYPEVAALTDSIRATLAGDLARLSRDYRLVIDGSRPQWRLTLLPSDPKIAAIVSRVTVDGRDDRIASFEVLQAGGDRSVTTIGPEVAGP